MMVTLPQPSGAFRWVQQGSRPALVCGALEPYARHFFTTGSWRLGVRSPDDDRRWAEVADAAGVGISRLIRLAQIHGADAVTYRKGANPAPTPRPRADIVLSDDASLALTVQTADCLPILMVDPRSGAAVAAHAGWRGLAACVPRVAVDRLAADVGSIPQDILVAIGPAVGACCYEVGDDVRTRFQREGFSQEQVERWFRSAPAMWAANPPMPSLSTERRPNHWFFDPWGCAREQLEQCGIDTGHIFGSDLCTASHPLFCSYRRDGTEAGRLAAVIRVAERQQRT